MFLINITYKKPLTEIDQYLAEHRAFLEEGYQKNYFIVSGPRNPRTGGVIISQLKDREELLKILQYDPFIIHDVADYELVEFMPVKYHINFSSFIS